MLRREPSLDLQRYQLRQRICRGCRWRPPGSEVLDASVPRSCEPDCQVFLRLPDLLAGRGCSIRCCVHRNRC
jgi:hypothetical protein